MQIARTLAVSLSVAAIASSLTLLPATARRPITITQRQESLQRSITKDEKSGEVTKKEADNLRDDMRDIAQRINKMKEKNGGKLSYKDEGKVEKNLNDVSLKIKKYELAKRVDAK